MYSSCLFLCVSLYFHSINAQQFDPIHYGAIGDGKADDTNAIRAALATVAANKGGMVLFDSQYTFLTGCFDLTSNIILNIKGTILASQNSSAYVPVGGGWCHGLIQNQKIASNITVTGGGTIDGQGAIWWACASGNTVNNYPCNGQKRPHLLTINKATDVHVSNIYMKDSPAWTTGFSECTNVHIDNVRITAPSDSHNTDGFDIDSSSNFLLENSFYSGGKPIVNIYSDDAIAIQSGTALFGGRSVENVLIRNLTIGTSHGLSIGSHTAGGVRNITFQDITCDGSDAGVKIKTQRGMGGLIEDITYKNIRLHNVRVAIWFTFNYVQNLPPGNTTATPQMKDVKIDNIFSDGAQYGWILDGLPEILIYNVAFSNINLINTNTSVRQCDNIFGFCYNVTPACPPCVD